ncbi:DUF2920 family protein [Robertmurraya sp. FSL W8-0741]|uniref:DUF2920 family protein n=1 Tax=Robertmurraya TaxID=2837507 RepID=UPI0010F7D2EC|nr:DUF2920 family protein [Robertmurraya siralis]
MSTDYEMNVPAHPNIYNNNSQREMKIYFSFPEIVNENTGLLLLIPGFGANAQSNVYKKMRTRFADEYNLITIQCHYFGQEFMQGSNRITTQISKEEVSNIFTSIEMKQVFGQGFNSDKFLQVGSKYNIELNVNEDLDEKIENFNDMGIMQALDHVTSLSYIVQILKENNLPYNTKKIILYGHSHGAYLCYLCNAFAPNLFTLLIDNSSWLYPEYLKSSRFLFSNIGQMRVNTEFSYLASRLDFDKGLLYLPDLYKQVDNNCNIICFHGTNDNLINHHVKKQFCEQVEGCKFIQIGQGEVDGKTFRSTSHGLDADFINLFDLVMKNRVFESSRDLNLQSNTIVTERFIYNIKYQNGVPLLLVQDK